MSSIIQNKFHELLGDVARPTKFNFYVPPLSNGWPGLTDIICYSVKSLELPKISHEPVVIRHKGRPIPVKGTTKYSQEFSVTFYLQENHIVKRFFEEWIAMLEQRHFYYHPRNEATRHATQNLMNWHPDFMTWYNPTLFVEQRNFDGDQITAIYEIFNCFPIDVSSVNYDYSNVGQVLDFTVRFACTHYRLHSSFPRDFGINGLTELNSDYPKTADLQVQLLKSTQRPKEKTFEYDPQRFVRMGYFYKEDPAGSLTDLKQVKEDTTGVQGVTYWRSYEKQRWDNMWNRWTEITGSEGGNRKMGTKVNDGLDMDREFPVPTDAQ